MHLRGHTPGSIALVWRGPDDAGTHVFTGDSLFPGGVGNTQQDPERFASLIDDVEERLFGALPDDTWVYPGHGKDTTIGAERPHLASGASGAGDRVRASGVVRSDHAECRPGWSLRAMRARRTDS